MIELQTLGDAVIKVGDREVRPTSPTLFAALLYLGVERGQRVSRAALQELLFPETDERSGAHSLRQLLYKLRQLGASVQAEGDVVWLAAEHVVDDYSAPVHANGNGANGHGRQGGQFLAGYSPRLSVGLDDWLEARRATIGAAQRRAQIKHMLARRDAADWSSVERIAQEILAGDPFNEEATFALAESTALSGSKSEAIRILERYESETGRADLKLPASILRRRISEKLPDRRRRALDTPFVGRDAEAQTMREAVVRLRAGEGGSIVIQGEPGIGKTRLIEETAALAVLEGVNVHVVRCQPHYVNRPMGVFIEWVPMLMQSRGALGVAPETLEHLKLLTSHRDDRADRPTDARDDATRSGTLLAAIRDLVDAVASEAPILLVVEDAHWADATSLRDLCVLLERRRNASVLVVHTARVTEPLASVGLLADTVPQLRLRPLGSGAMRDLSGQLLAGTTPARDDVREWCAATAAGNPFYLQMLCAHYEETQQPFVVPPGVRNATMRRLEQTPATQRRLLEFSALLGRHATLSALRTLLEVSNAPFIDAVQALEEAGFLRTHDGAARLSHDVLRECTLESIPVLTKQLLHGVVAAHLEARYAESPETSLLWDCTEHLVASGESRKATEFVLHCARHSTDIGRASIALDLLQRWRPQAAGTELLAVLRETSRAAKAARQWDVVVEAEDAVTSITPSAARSEHTDSELRSIEGRWTLTMESTETGRLLECATSPTATHQHRVAAAYLATKIAHEVGDTDLAHAAYAAVETILRPESPTSDDGILKLVYHTSFGNHDIALETARLVNSNLAAIDIASQLRIGRNLAVAWSYLGYPEEALDLNRRQYHTASRLELVSWQFELASSAVQALLYVDDASGAEEWFLRAESLVFEELFLMSALVHRISGVEIAILMGNREMALQRQAALNNLNSGDSIRFPSHLKSLVVRVAQMDQSYQCPEHLLLELRQLYDSAVPLAAADGLVEALGEALVRRREVKQLRALMGDYLRRRRTRLPLPGALRRLAALASGATID